MNTIFTKNSFALVPFSLAVYFLIENQIFNRLVGLYHNPFIFQYIFITFSLGVLLYSPSLFLSKWLRYAYLALVSMATTSLFVSQYLYFSFFGGFMQASALKYAGQTADQSGTIIHLISPVLLFFIFPFCIIARAIFLEQKGKIQNTIHKRKDKTKALFAIFLIGIFGYSIVLFGKGNGWSKITNISQTIHEINSFVFSPNEAVQRTGITNYFVSDFIGLVFRKTTLSESDVSLVETWRDQKNDKKNNATFGKARYKNFIIVQFESLENVVIFQKINGKEITPNLNRLAREGVYFDNYYTQVGPGNTADAEFVTLNSLYALSNTVAFVDFAHNKYNALPALLGVNGYHTYSLHADAPTFWNRSNIYPALGYQKTFSKPDFVFPKFPEFANLSDQDFYTQSLEKIQTFDSPYMATLITLSSHTPFEIPERYKELTFAPDSPYNQTQQNYLQSVRYSDRALGEFIQGLKDDGQYDRSLIAIYGDHGSLTGLGNILATSTSRVFPELRASVEGSVPLILLNTGLKPKTSHVAGSHLDLYPTVANLLGIESTVTLFGHDLFGKEHVVTIRNAYSRAIITILTEKMAYKNFTDLGTFENGTCIALPQQTPLPLDSCRRLFERELATTNASDLIIRGNISDKLLIP